MDKNTFIDLTLRYIVKAKKTLKMNYEIVGIEENEKIDVFVSYVITIKMNPVLLIEEEEIIKNAVFQLFSDCFLLFHKEENIFLDNKLTYELMRVIN